MSRVGKRIINIPKGTEVSFSGREMIIKGPLGEIKRDFKPQIGINISDDEITLKPVKTNKENVSLWGTYSSHISNMIDGVNKVFEKKLIVEGVGFKSEISGEEIILNLGFSHPIKMDIPKDLKVTVEKNVICISGINKESVGQFAAKIRLTKKPEPYKGKGIRYEGEIVRRKQGKKSV